MKQVVELIIWTAIIFWAAYFGGHLLHWALP